MNDCLDLTPTLYLYLRKERGYEGWDGWGSWEHYNYKPNYPWLIYLLFFNFGLGHSQLLILESHESLTTFIRASCESLVQNEKLMTKKMTKIML